MKKTETLDKVASQKVSLTVHDSIIKAKDSVISVLENAFCVFILYNVHVWLLGYNIFTG